MAKFTVETTFDSSENLVFACLDINNTHVGIVKTKDENITFTNGLYSIKRRHITVHIVQKSKITRRS